MCLLFVPRRRFTSFRVRSVFASSTSCLAKHSVSNIGPFDLHVLSTPPAFVLSQDQTLHKKVIILALVLILWLIFFKSRDLVMITFFPKQVPGAEISHTFFVPADLNVLDLSFSHLSLAVLFYQDHWPPFQKTCSLRARIDYPTTL